MSTKEPWYKGWWLIPLIILLGVVAWKVYPIVKTSELVKKMVKK